MNNVSIPSYINKLSNMWSGTTWFLRPNAPSISGWHGPPTNNHRIPGAHANAEVNVNPKHLTLTKAELFARIHRPGEPDEMTDFVNSFDHIHNYLCQVSISSPVDHEVDLKMTGTSNVVTCTQVAQRAAPEYQVAPDEEAAPEDSVTQASNFDHDYDVSNDETRRPAPHPSQVTLPLQSSPTVQEDRC